VGNGPVIASLADFDTFPLASWVLELDGTVVAANQAAQRLAPAAQSGRRAWDIAVEVEGHWTELVRAVVSFGSYITELEIRVGTGAPPAAAPHRGAPAVAPPDGGAVRSASARAVQVHASLREHAGRRYVLLIATDITALRARYDDERRRATGERVESLGIVAGGIAHELNNQLVNVIAEAGNLREDELVSVETKDALVRVELSAKRMARLTRQLLAYAGRGRFVTSLVDADVLLAEKAATLAPRMPGGVTLEVAVGAGMAAIQVDSALLRQVVQELVENACEAMRGLSGKIDINSRNVTEADRRWWQLEVRDEGVGMDANTQARIFDPFFSTKPDRHGLGLSAALGIVRRLGGDIGVESQSGRGTTVRVRLPIVADAVPPRRRATSEGPPLHALAGLNILVADDEPSVRATVQRLLERRSASCVLAADGAEAEALLRRERFDVVLLDVMMPKRTGYELVAIARATQPAASVILMSGYSEQASDVEPPDAFLEKPFNGTTLEETILSALAGIVANGRSGSEGV
jgi:signal transduction histidine kinase